MGEQINNIFSQKVDSFSADGILLCMKYFNVLEEAQLWLFIISSIMELTRKDLDMAGNQIIVNGK